MSPSYFAHAICILGIVANVAMFAGAFTKSFALSMIGLLCGFGFVAGIWVLVQAAQ